MILAMKHHETIPAVKTMNMSITAKYFLLPRRALPSAPLPRAPTLQEAVCFLSGQISLLSTLLNK